MSAPVMKQGEASVITVAMDEPLQISVETDDGSSMWAACTVRSIDAGSGEFSVWVTEWADLDPEDPEYEEAYEEHERKRRRAESDSGSGYEEDEEEYD